MTGLPIPASDKIYGTSVAMNIENSHCLMKCTVLICLLTLVLCGHSLAQETLASAHAANCSPAVLDIHGNKIWMNEEGKGNITVVFEAGFGNDSSVWSQITPRIQAAGVQTFVYDRAGMGKSTINTSTPYSIDNDVSYSQVGARELPYQRTDCDGRAFLRRCDQFARGIRRPGHSRACPDRSGRSERLDAHGSRKQFEDDAAAVR